jgi:aspartate ammonia-lyase
VIPEGADYTFVPSGIAHAIPLAKTNFTRQEETMTGFRTEKDLLGEREVPCTALYGIHTVRGVENFPLARRPVNPALIHAFGAVKLACARTNHGLGWWDEPTAHAIETACLEMMAGELDGHVIVDALQGGAGTSTNMNVNEVLANRALALLGKDLGDYGSVSPIADLNLHQSTNDTYPTALKVAAIQRLRDLEREVVALLEEFQGKEKAFAHVVKVGRTQLQDAVLVTLGREMAAYAEAFGRDRWRIYKCEERLRVVNLGGTAVGTGLAAPRQYIFQVTEQLRTITGLGLARAENLIEATQNADVFVEVSGILKACASNLFKIASDLRLLSSGPDAGFGELRLPPRQAGSSIMPGKINPVIPEAVSQAALAVMAHDQSITLAASLGNLELNAFMPLIADSLLTSLDLLINACSLFRRLCIAGLEVDEARCRSHVDGASATLTALVDRIGYQAAQDIAAEAKASGRGIRAIVVARGLLAAEAFDELVSAESVTRLGSPIRKEKTSQ